MNARRLLAGIAVGVVVVLAGLRPGAAEDLIPVPDGTLTTWFPAVARGDDCAVWHATPSCLMDALIGCRYLDRADLCDIAGIANAPKAAAADDPGPWRCFRLIGAWEYLRCHLPHGDNPYGLEVGDVAFTVEVAPRRDDWCETAWPTETLSALLREDPSGWRVVHHSTEIDYVRAPQERAR